MIFNFNKGLDLYVDLREDLKQQFPFKRICMAERVHESPGCLVKKLKFLCNNNKSTNLAIDLSPLNIFETARNRLYRMKVNLMKSKKHICTYSSRGCYA